VYLQVLLIKHNIKINDEDRVPAITIFISLIEMMSFDEDRVTAITIFISLIEMMSFDEDRVPAITIFISLIEMMSLREMWDGDNHRL